MTDKEEHMDEKHPKINLNDLDKGLIRFCLECGKMNPNVKSALPKRDPADYKWLRMVYDSIEDDAKHMARLLTDVVHYIALEDEKKDEDAQEKVIDTLEELYDLVENIENANDLITLGGVPALLDLLRDSSRPRVCAESCGVVSAIMANNPHGQNALFQAGALSFIFSALRTFQKQAEGKPEGDEFVQAEARAINAVSALVRQMPEAQKQFIDDGGMVLLRNALETPSSTLRLRAASALWRFSTTKENVTVLVREGFVHRLLTILTSLDHSINDSLREAAANVLAQAAQFPDAKAIITLQKEDINAVYIHVEKIDPQSPYADFLRLLLSRI